MMSKKLIPIFLFSAAALFAEHPANEGGHGGDVILQRILIARPLSLQIVNRAKELRQDQRDGMTAALLREPKFSKPGEKVTAPDERGNPVEVSARYDSDTGLITFNMDLCRTQLMSQLDAIALYLHEAGYAVGLSKSMARRREDFLSDIGNVLVTREMMRADSLFREDAFLAAFLSTMKTGSDGVPQPSLPPATPSTPLIPPARTYEPAQPPHVYVKPFPGTYGNIAALAFSKSTGKWEVSRWAYPTQPEANADALALCRQNNANARDCEIVFFSWGCAAFAYGDARIYGWAAYGSVDDSSRLALSECEKNNQNCRVKQTFCVTGG